MVMDTLVKIQDQISVNEIELIFTDQLADMVIDFDWNERDDYPILIEIYHLLNQWALQSVGIVRIDTSNVDDYHNHPIPEGCEALGSIDVWSEELGRLLSIHDCNCSTNHYFIGVACESAYNSGIPRNYINPRHLRVFPLIGPNNIPFLDDAYTWNVRPEIRNRSVSFENVLRNHRVIGTYRLERPSGSSHFELKFKGGRTWPLSSNIDPVSEEFLRELIPITGYPLEVIKYGLLFGELPETKSRI